MAGTMESLRRDSRYRALLRHALLRLVGLYFIPLLLLTLFFHFQYRIVLREIERRHVQSLAEHQAGLLNMFLGDRLLNLMDLTDDTVSLLDPVPEDLAARLAGLQSVQRRLRGSGGPGSRRTGPGLRRARYQGSRTAATGRSLVRAPAGRRSSHVITDVYPVSGTSPISPWP